MTNTTLKAHLNKALTSTCKGYHEEIPLDEIFRLCREYVGQPLDIDGTPLSVILCGTEGQMHARIENSRWSLVVTWFTMPSGRIEVTAYVS